MNSSYTDSHLAQWDVLVVGGGAAGAVMARRLSEDPSRRVLLLEAGVVYASNAYPDLVRRQNMIGGYEQHDWGYAGEPSVLGRSIPLPRGKVLGGSCAINGAVATRAKIRPRPMGSRTRPQRLELGRYAPRISPS